MSLLVVGSVAFDDLQTPAGIRENLLGGSASFFSLSASHFHPVQIVAVVGEDFGPAQRRVFEGRDIDLAGLSAQTGLSFHWKGAYGLELAEAQTLDTQLNVFATFHPDLPATYRKSPFLFLGNIDPELQLEVLSQVDVRPRWVALDTMNFWIQGKPQALRRVLADVDILLVNEAECRALTGERNLVRGFELIRAMGPQVLVVKRGEYGSLLLTDEGSFACPALPLADVVDPTGAGDSFAGGFLGHLAHQDSMDFSTLKYAVVAGTVMSSFTVQGFGLERLQAVNAAEIAERLSAFLSMIQVDGI
jgi:hypothetical protein